MKQLGLSCNKGKSETICSVCPKVGVHGQSFPLSNSRASRIFELIHVDIWGAYKCVTHDGYKYFLTIVDDYSRATWVHLMSTKSNAFPLLQQFTAFVKNQFEVTIKTVRTDNGMKFQDNSALQFYAKKGIIDQRSCVDTPQQNGVVERKHKHLSEVARALMMQADLPSRF